MRGLPAPLDISDEASRPFAKVAAVEHDAGAASPEPSIAGQTRDGLAIQFEVDAGPFSQTAKTAPEANRTRVAAVERGA